jgi:hypothetical protein
MMGSLHYLPDVPKANNEEVPAALSGLFMIFFMK